MDLTDGPPPQKKIWPEIKEAEEAPPPADSKSKTKADKEKKKKLIDVRNKFYLRLHFRQFLSSVTYGLQDAKLQTCVKRFEALRGFPESWSCPKR